MSHKDVHISESGGNGRSKGPEAGTFLPYSATKKERARGHKGSQGVGCYPMKGIAVPERREGYRRGGPGKRMGPEFGFENIQSEMLIRHADEDAK